MSKPRNVAGSATLPLPASYARAGFTHELVEEGIVLPLLSRTEPAWQPAQVDVEVEPRW